MDASWSEKASSRSSLTQSGRQKMAEDSPTDRVERLLRKYKVPYFSSVDTENYHVA